MAEDKNASPVSVDYSSIAKVAIDEFDEIMKSKKLVSEYKKANIDIMETVRRLPVIEMELFVFAAYEHLTFAELSLFFELNEKEILSTLAKSNETLLKELKTHC